MAISGNIYPFTREYVNKSPTTWGVYALYDGSETIYIGKATGVTGIREQLRAHKQGEACSCTKNASHYRHESCSNPSGRERQLLQEYKFTNGVLPRCNDVIP